MILDGQGKEWLFAVVGLHTAVGTLKNLRNAKNKISLLVPGETESSFGWILCVHTVIVWLIGTLVYRVLLVKISVFARESHAKKSIRGSSIYIE